MNPPRYFLALEAAALHGPGSDPHLDALSFGIPCSLHDAHESVVVRARARASEPAANGSQRALVHTLPSRPASRARRLAHDVFRMRMLGMN